MARAASNGQSTSESGSAQAAPRSYSVYKEVMLDLSDPEALVAYLHEVFGEAPTLEGVIRVGRSDQRVPKAALAAIAEEKSLNGEYNVASDSAFKRFSVKVENKPRATVS